MKLVIDIHEKDYKSILNRRYVSSGAVDAIMHGILLPHGHGRLIDADALELDYDWSEYETDTGQLIVNGYQAYSSTQVESAPTIIEADREGR